MMILIIALAVIFILVLLYAAFVKKASDFIYNGSMIRNDKKGEDAIRMTGVDWSLYKTLIQERYNYMEGWERENPEQMTGDGLTLRAAYFPYGEQKKIVIAFHGYTSDGIINNLGVSGFFRRKGYSMLLPDARAHGRSDGTYIGFGSLDRYDALLWINWVIDRCGNDAEIWLYGQSMGATTVLLAGALGLPPQVKGIISDSAFSSANDIFSHVLRNIRHLPPYFIMKRLDQMSKRNAGFGLDDSNALGEVGKIRIPVLFMHGTADPFVPAGMCDDLYEACRAEKKKVLFDGASHIEGYYKDTEKYENELEKFLENK